MQQVATQQAVAAPNESAVTANDETEVFATKHTAMYFTDSSEVFRLSFFQDRFEFRFCELMVLRNKLRTIDFAELLASDTPDVKVLHMKHCDRLLILGIRELLALREVIDGTFVMLELNSIIHSKLVRVTL